VKKLKKINKIDLKAGVVLITAAIILSGLIVTANPVIKQETTEEIESIDETLPCTAMNGDAEAYLWYDLMESWMCI